MLHESYRGCARNGRDDSWRQISPRDLHFVSTLTRSQKYERRSWPGPIKHADAASRRRATPPITVPHAHVPRHGLCPEFRNYTQLPLLLYFPLLVLQLPQGRGSRDRAMTQGQGRTALVS
eukprot:scaffold82159_cov69-Phaeocystis_antarctica.AAC.1